MHSRGEIVRNLKGYGYTVTKVSSLLGITRPTLNKYLDLYCQGDVHLVPEKIRNLATLVLDKKTTVKDVDEYFTSLPLIDVRSTRDVKYLSSDIFKFNHLYDVRNKAWTNKVKIPKNEERLTVDFDKVVIDSRVKILEYGMQAGFSRYGALGIPLPSEYELRFDDNRIHDLYYQYFHLLYLYSYLSNDMLLHSEVADVAELRGNVEYAMSCIEYLFRELKDGDDEDDLDYLLSEVNRETFDVTRKRRWYVVPSIACVVDDYPTDEAAMFLATLGAVSVDDAMFASTDYYGQIDGYDIRETAIFGPFDNEEEGKKIQNYIDLSWQATFSDENPPTVDKGIEWLNAQKKVKSLHWAGV
ncbi:MAG: hypothetical protein IKQ67_07280 [Candidatus Methanomethylophilaceae archaeon]|nr:hypothetical protein [Candidatus Methanomethylophilaceae archaeon]